MSPEIAAALQLLAGAISGLPAQMVLANAAAKNAAENAPGRPAVFDKPQPVIVVGPNPLPVTGGTVPKGPAPKQPTAPGAAGSGSMLGMFGPLLAKFAAAVGPLAVLGQVLGATTSGFQILSKSVQLFAMVVAPVLLPVTMLLATAFTAMADVLMATGVPALEGLFGLFMSLGVPILILFVGVIQWVSDQLKTFGEWLKRNTPNGFKDPLEGKSDPFRAIYEQEIKYLNETEFGGSKPRQIFDAFVSGNWEQEGVRTRHDEAMDRTRARIAAGEGAGLKPSGNDPRSVVMNALRDVANSFSQSMAPKAQISGLEGVGKSVQLAALNSDPLEARMLKVQETIANMIQAYIAQQGGSPGGVYTPEAGEGGWFSRRGGGDPSNR